MPIYTAITYSWHAQRQMQRRRVHDTDVALVLRVGEGYPNDEEEAWIYEFGTLRVVVVERGDIAHVVTVIRLRKHT